MGTLVPVLQPLLTIGVVLLPLLLIRQHLAAGHRGTRLLPTAEQGYLNEGQRRAVPGSYQGSSSNASGYRSIGYNLFAAL